MADKLHGKRTLAVSGILDEFEKDRIKARVDIVSLFASFDVTLERKGKTYMGRCPWHEDTNPSLSVDREKGLYNCFGCGESGDAFSLAQKMKGLDFSAALRYLSDFAVSAPPVAKRNGAGKRAAAVKRPEEPDAAERTRLLAEVSRRWERSLAENAQARKYLEGRGLWAPEVLRRFHLGYSDGELAGVVGAQQRAELTRLGVLRAEGAEHFAGCLTVPLYDESSQIVGFYGRRIGEGQPAHLYLRGPHRGLVNREAARVYRDRLVLAESVLDALSLIAVGIENVIPCYGTGGFTEEHRELLASQRVTTVLVAFDADEAGRRAAAKLVAALGGEGIAVAPLEPEKGKDWNEALTAGVSAEQIRAHFDTAFAAAEADRKAAALERSGELIMTREVGRYLFTRPGVRYRLVGVRESFAASLRVSLRTELTDAASEGRRYVDTVDLYSARSRSSYAASCAPIGLEAARIEHDLLTMLDLLEAERDARLAFAEEKPRELTLLEREAGLELLGAPDIAERIVADLAALGYVGERVNKLLVYLAATSRKLSEPLSVIVSSQSAAGKSLLIDTVARLLRPEEVISATSLSEQALNYLGEDALLHKFLVLGEAVHSEAVEHQVREMLSARELSRLVTLKDEKTGELRSRLVKKPAVVALAMSTTRSEVNPENASRFFIVASDESEAQTRAVHEAQAERYRRGGWTGVDEHTETILTRHRAAQRLLEPVGIANPYAHLLRFPTRLMRTRRDHRRFLDLIAVVGFLRQMQKQRHQDEQGRQYILCDLPDYRLAYEILTHVLTSTLSSLPRSVQDLYEAFRAAARTKAEREHLQVEEALLTQRELREAAGFPAHQVKRALRLLVDYEYLLVSGSLHRGSRRGYRLVRDEALTLVNTTDLLSPEELEEAARREGIEV